MMFDEPVLLQLGWWYVAWARVSGPSSDCGSHGQATITTDDGYEHTYYGDYFCIIMLEGKDYHHELSPAVWCFSSRAQRNQTTVLM